MLWVPPQLHPMMLSKVEAGKKTGQGSSGGKLLKEVETISKALYLDRSTSRNLLPTTSSRSKSIAKADLPDPKSKTRVSNEDTSRKDKKSIWNWRPLKAFSHIRNKRFNCCFSLQVHLIEELPSTFDNNSLCVHWKRRDGVLVTCPAKVIQGTAEFEEKLTYTCSVYGSRNGPHHSAKYEAKHFLLYASILGASEVDLGKHRVDLTRLLPLTLEELEEEKSTGKWTTSFRLSGMARGAVMNVSFGYMVVGDNTCANRDHRNASNVLTSRQNVMKPDIKPNQVGGKSSLQPIGSLTSYSNNYSARSVDEVKNLHEVLPISRSTLAGSIDILYQKFDDEKTSPVHDKPEPDAFTEDVKPIEPDSYPLTDSAKENSEKYEGDKANTYSLVHVKPEFDVSTEIVEPNQLHDYSVSNNGIENPQRSEGENNSVTDHGIENPEFDYSEGDKENTYSLVHVKPEFDVSTEIVEPNELHDYSVSNNGIENPQRSEGENNSVTDHGIEAQPLKPIKLEESIINVPDAYPVNHSFTLDPPGMHVSSEDCVKHDSFNEESDNSKEMAVGHEHAYVDDDLCNKELLMQELESALNSISDWETAALDSPEDENYMGYKSEDKMRKTHSLDDVTECEFLSMLGINHSASGLNSESEPESPRERLLRQFEEEAQAEGFSLFDFDIGNEDKAEGGYRASIVSEQWNISEDLKSSSLFEDLNEEHLDESQEVMSKQRAKILEDLETEALLREWGINENAFQHSPPDNSAGFGSPINSLPEEPFGLPSLAEGLGPFLQTKDGGFLRSMNPSLFSNAKAGGNLIMQVSNPVVLPAEMGSGIMEILQRLASVGIEKLSMQANKLMPLEDITGKTIQQVAWEAIPVLEGTDRQCSLQYDLVTEQDTTCMQRDLHEKSSRLKSNKFSSSPVSDRTGSEFLSLEDLAPMAMDKIEALSIEGLRIQSGMSDEDAPSNIVAQSIGDFSALQGKTVNTSGSLGLDGAAGLQLLGLKDSSDNVDGIMGLSLTLDEWMRLDSGEIDDMDNISDHTSKILAAHHANSFDSIRGKSKGERKRGKGTGRKSGLLGNNFTVALMVQLRDPLRNYEPVGTPMLALIQVERVFVPPKPKIYCNVSEMRNNSDGDDESETVAKVETKDDKKEEKSSGQEGIPQFRISEVHVAGLETEPQKKKLWGTSSQQQSGSRWLLANGMGKSNKHPLLKTKGSSKFDSAGDKLWSVSSRVRGSTRNSNVILPNETKRFR